MSIYRKMILILVVCVLAIGVAGAENKTLKVAFTAGRNPNVNIVQDYGNISWSDVLTAEFQKTYPHIDIEYTVSTLEKTTVLIASGIGEDIINGAATAFVNLGRQGAFVDLAPLLRNEGIDYVADQTFWPQQWEAFRHNGVQFALPQYLGTVAMYYNVDMFDAMGLARPSPSLSENRMDWGEFENITKRLTRDINGDGVIDVYGFQKTFNANRVHFWMIPAGAELYADGDKSRSALNSEAAIAGMEFLQKLRWESGVIAPPGVSASWTSQTAAIQEEGSWRLAATLGVKQDGSPKMPFTWNVFPMPLGPAGKRATMANIDGYAINRNTEHLPEAYALIKFLAGPEANAIKAKYVALQPANRRVVPEYIRLMRTLNRDLYDVDVHVFTDAGPYAYPQPLYSNQEAASSLLSDLVSRVINQNQPARSVWTEGVARLNRILAAVVQHVEISMPESLSWAGTRWNRQDFNVDVAGKAEIKDGKLHLWASGADIWGIKDGFGFAHQKVKGDFTATLRLHRAPVGDSWTKAGLMMRAALDASSPQVTIMGTGANGILAQYRREHAGSSVSAAGRQSKWKNGDPVYFKLVRRGNDAHTYWSEDGVKWTVFERIRLDLGDEVYVGPGVTSHVKAELGEAIFSDWSLVLE